MNSITKVRNSKNVNLCETYFPFLLQFKIFCFLCVAFIFFAQTVTTEDQLPVEFDPDLVFTKPQKPVLRHLSEPEQAEYKDFLQYLYRYDTKKIV